MSGAAGGSLPCQPRSATRSAAAPRAGRAWSTFGPHAIGTERFATVSSGTSSRRSRVRSCGNRTGSRTLIRMRSQVQVLAGPSAKALPERLPATPLDRLARRQPQQLPFWRRLSGRLEIHTAAGHSGWVACYKIVRPYPQQQLRVVYRQVEDPAGSLAASTRPDLAWRARLSGAGAETPAQPGAHSPPAPPSQRQPRSVPAVASRDP